MRLNILSNGHIRRTSYDGTDYVGINKQFNAINTTIGKGNNVHDAFILFIYRLIAHIGIVRNLYYNIYEDLMKELNEENQAKLRLSMNYMRLFENEYVDLLDAPNDYIWDYELNIEKGARQYVFILQNMIVGICWESNYPNPLFLGRAETTRFLMEMLITFNDMTLKMYKNTKMFRVSRVNSVMENFRKCFGEYESAFMSIYPKINKENALHSEDKLLNAMNTLFMFVNKAYNIIINAESAFQENRNMFKNASK